MINNWHGAKQSNKGNNYSTKIHCASHCGIQTVRSNQIIGNTCLVSYSFTICRHILLTVFWCWWEENHCMQQFNWDFFFNTKIHKINQLLFFSLVNIQKRISQGLKVLQYYTTKNWTFKNEKFLRMKENMSEKDQNMFYFSVEEVR